MKRKNISSDNDTESIKLPNVRRRLFDAPNNLESDNEQRMGASQRVLITSDSLVVPPYISSDSDTESIYLTDTRRRLFDAPNSIESEGGQQMGTSQRFVIRLRVPVTSNIVVSPPVVRNDIGTMDTVCGNCGAKRFKGESSGFCCAGSKVFNY